MPRKAAPAPPGDDFEDFDNLDTGETLVIQDTRTIKREPAQASAKTVVIEPDDDDSAGDDQPEFSDDSLFSLISAKHPQPDDEFCTLHIRRDPDSTGDKFLTPCGSRLTLPAMRNIPLEMDKSEIEDKIRAIHGGGHYLITVHYRGRFVTSFQLHLADSPEAIAAARAAAQQPPQAQPAAIPATSSINPLVALAENFEQMNRLKLSMFGDELKELEELRRRDRERQTPTPAETKPEKIQLLEFAVNSQNERLIERAIGALFGSDDDSEKNNLLDVAKFVLANKTEIVGIGQQLLGGILAPAAAPQPTRAGIEKLLGKRPQPIEVTPQPAPATVEPAQQSTFRKSTRRQPKTDKDTAA